MVLKRASSVSIGICSNMLKAEGMLFLNFGKQIFDGSFLSILKDHATAITDEICLQLDRLNLFYRNSPNAEMMTSRRAKAKIIEYENQYNFKYKEVSSRCFGRLDIRYKLDSHPFTSPLLAQHNIIIPIVKNLIGDDMELRYTGLVVSFPGSSTQPWHADGPHLFGSCSHQTPCHALNVFIPLTDISDTMGPTEFIPKSHLQDELHTYSAFYDSLNDSEGR